MVYGHACKINANKTYHWLHGVYQRVETGNLMQAVAISTCICRSGFSTAYATANFIICIMTSKQRPWHDDPAMIGTTFYNTLMTRLWLVHFIIHWWPGYDQLWLVLHFIIHWWPGYDQLWSVLHFITHWAYSFPINIGHGIV